MLDVLYARHAGWCDGVEDTLEKPMLRTFARL
jgi:hypothetical protein